MWRRILLVFVVSIGMLWGEDGLSLGGWVRIGEGGAVIVRTNTLENWMYVGQTTWRLSVANRDTEYGRFDASLDIHLLRGGMTNVVFSPLLWSIGEETALAVDIRKLSLLIKPSWGDVILGRQLVRWGEGVIFSPMDFFSRLDVMDTSLSRLGVDALRVKIPLGEVGIMEGIGMLRASWTNATLGMRLGQNVLPSWYLSGALFYQGESREWMGGISLKGDLGPTWYGEAIYHGATNTSRSFWHIMVGMDYSLAEKWVFRLEYVTHTLEITNLSSLERASLSLYPFLSRHYGSLQVVMMPTLLDSVSLTLIANLDDPEEHLLSRGQMWIARYTRNLYQNVNLLTWIRYQTDITALMPERQGGISAMVSVEVKY